MTPETAEVPVEEIEVQPAPLSPLTHGPVDSVLLIDGDNDPHLPPQFVVTEYTLVRVFLRPQAKMPRGLERRLGHLPQCVAVVSPKGGANAADFIMSLHAGLLHGVLPMSIPFTMVTNDKSLAAMVQELQRIGRQAILWTSHPDVGSMRVVTSSESAPPQRSRSGRGRSGGRSRGGRSAAAPASASRRAPARGRRRAAPANDPVKALEAAAAREEKEAAQAAVAAAETPALAPSAESPAGRSLAQVASSYAARLSRIKDPPSRIKTLLNDIKNRAASSGFSPETILEELKRSHGVTVDANGKVHRAAA